MNLRKTILGAVCSLFLSMPTWASTSELTVVASFSILGDLAEQAGGDRIKVYTLVGPDSDAHAYTPTPADARRLSEADLVLVNGLDFEGWIDRLIAASGYSGQVLVASHGVEPLRSHGHGHGHDDPHAWQDVRNVMRYVENIAAALATIDPDGAETYRDRAEAYRLRLESLDQTIHNFVAELPPERRKVVASHDAFGYFEAAYGLRFVPALGSQPDAELSAREMAALVRQIRQESIHALFLENISNPRLLESIARETGVRIGGKLYSDAFSPPGGPAHTYLDMMQHNLDVLRSALETRQTARSQP